MAKLLFRYRSVLCVLIFTVISISCGSPEHPEGLAKAGGGNGPVIIFDPLAKPVPEIPFPNDLATVLDESTITGRRINISTEASTEVERDVRRSLNTLDGFGTYSPISLRFDAPLDLSTVNENDIIVVQTVGPRVGHSPRLDLGKGFFPLIWQPDRPWWPHDPYANANNVVMDPANMADLDGDTVAEFVDFYEFATNTLIIRPITPLDEASRYAVVILRDVRGLNGEPVRSPFEYINHTMQTNDLQPLIPILQQRGIPLEKVAFCWSFTTQSVTSDWLRIWNGLNGSGPLAYLASWFPPLIRPTDLKFPGDGDGNNYTIDAQWFEPIIKTVAGLIGEDDYVAIADFRYVDYFVFGTFESPSFFYHLNFGHPLYTPAVYFDPDKLSGAKPVDRLTVTWMLTVPKDEDRGVDGCQDSEHPFGCADWEEAGAKGADDGFGFAGIDDNEDGYVDDRGEYLWQGSDDVPDPAGDNYNPNDPVCQALVASNDLCVPPSALHCTQGNKRLDYDCGPDLKPGIAGVDDDGNTIVDDITEFGTPGSDDGASEDANGDGRLNTPPFPVAFYGHGHTSSRVESIGFAGPMAMAGIALFGMDNFGHGPMTEFGNLDKFLREFLISMGFYIYTVCDASLPPPCGLMYDPDPATPGLMELLYADLNGDKVVDINDVLNKTVDQILTETFHLPLFAVLGTEGRAYDIDGDTIPDSGDIFWTANILQTRDLVRQTAIDWLQFVRVVDNFGTRASFDWNGDTIADIDGDFNFDGQYDLGGPTNINTRGHFYFGSSLGGIMGDINMGMNPRMVVGAPVAGAGGLPDVVPRSHQRSATEPVMLQMCGPVIVGTYDNVVKGRATLTFNDDPLSQAFGHIYLPDNGRVQVRNLSNGEVKLVTAKCHESNPTCGPGEAVNFSIGIAADIGDTLEITSLDDISGPVRSTVIVQSKYKGHGLQRNSPDLRRFIALAQWAIERGDPINLAPHYFTNENGLPLPGFPDKAVLQINTTGDQNVPINTGNSIATAAGLWTYDQAIWLINKGVNLGYVPPPYAPTSQYIVPIFDPEDVDDDDLKCGWAATDPRCTDDPPFQTPLPPVPSGTSGRVSAVRLPYVDERAHHAFALPVPSDRNHGIDWGVYMANQIVYYFASDGTCVIDDPWELHSAPYIDPGPNGVLESVPQGDDKIRTVRVVKTLGLNPCNYPFPTKQIITTGPNWQIDSPALVDDVIVNYNKLYRGP